MLPHLDCVEPLALRVCQDCQVEEESPFTNRLQHPAFMFSTRQEIKKKGHLPQNPGRAREKRRHLRLTIVFIPTSKVEARQNQRKMLLDKTQNQP